MPTRHRPQYGVYAMDTLHLSEAIAATVSMRYNYASIAISDRTGETPALNGTNTYRRFNPAAGATWNLVDGATLYANWSQGMRVPTPVELTCADPNAPCTLPNIFVADPPLLPVIGTTFELGARRAVVDAGIARRAAGAPPRTARPARRHSSSSPPRRVPPIRGTFRISAAPAARDSSSRQAPPPTLSPSAPPTAIRARPSRRDSSRTAQQLDGERRGNDRGHFGQPHTRHPCPTAEASGDLVAAFPPRYRRRVHRASGQYARGDENNLDAAGPVPGTQFSISTFATIRSRWELFANINNVFADALSELRRSGDQFLPWSGQRLCAFPGASRAIPRSRCPLGAWVGVRHAFSDGLR
jgi:hypothetical protein